MKKIFAIMAMAFMGLGIATVTTSCTSDEEEEVVFTQTANNNTVLGDWGVVMTNASTNTIEWVGEMIFSADGTVSINTDNPQVAQWKLNGNALEISHDSKKVVNTIKQKDTNAMVLEYKQNDERHTMLMRRVTSEESLKEFISQWEHKKPADDKSALNEAECVGCPYCDGKMCIPYYAGLVVITSHYSAGGPIGGGIHVQGETDEEYQFHYYRCDTCGKGWQMYEYRETPSWWDDFWGINPEFKRGDIITLYLMEKIASHQYINHVITRW